MDFAGSIRDRKYGDAVYQNKSFIVVDTGGIGENEGGIDTYMAEQSKKLRFMKQISLCLWWTHAQVYWLLMNKLPVNCVL